MKNLTQIISQCKEQDRSAQQQLYTYTYTKLAAAVAVYSKDNSERDWIFNLGMMRVFTSLNKFSIESNYLGWARTLLVRSAIDHYRKNKKHKDNHTTLGILNYNVSSQDFESMMNKLDTGSIISILQKLPAKTRLIFSMYEMDGYSHKEIYQMTGININTSKWLLAKSKKTLKTIIKNSMDLKNLSYGR